MGRSFLSAAGAVACALGFCLVGCGTVLGTFEVSQDGGPGTTGGEGGVKTGDGGATADGSSSVTDAGMGVTGDGGKLEGGTGGAPCTIDAKGQSPECTSAQYCLSTDCKTGTCMHMPLTETDTNFTPVCGCNDVNYYNEQVAARHGQSSQPGPCAAGFPCVTGKCALPGVNYGCWAAVGSCSGAPPPMTCMGLPASCPDAPKYKGCTKGCAPVCTLIEQSDAYQATLCN